MDPHGQVHLKLGDAFFDSNCEALSYFAGIRTEIMESDNSIGHIGVILANNQLCVAVI
mgnify:CR=1 FL=1